MIGRVSASELAELEKLGVEVPSWRGWQSSDGVLHAVSCSEAQWAREGEYDPSEMVSVHNCHSGVYEISRMLSDVVCARSLLQAEWGQRTQCSHLKRDPGWDDLVEGLAHLKEGWRHQSLVETLEFSLEAREALRQRLEDAASELVLALGSEKVRDVLLAQFGTRRGYGGVAVVSPVESRKTLVQLVRLAWPSRVREGKMIIAAHPIVVEGLVEEYGAEQVMAEMSPALQETFLGMWDPEGEGELAYVEAALDAARRVMA